MRYIELIDRLQAVKVLVIGDVMLDSWYFGRSYRTTNEWGDSHPIIDVESTTSQLGGAANAARACRSLGCDVRLIGVIGSDFWGGVSEKLCVAEGIDHCFFVDDRCTTVKIRVLAGECEPLRIDQEVRAPIPLSLENNIIDQLLPSMVEADIVLVSDYHKGTLTPGLLREIFRQGTRTLVDPKGHDFRPYKGASVIKTNRAELEGSKLTYQNIHDQTNSFIVQTLGAKGLEVWEPFNGIMNYGPIDVPVVDAIGAGDVVLATLGCSVASGLTLQEAGKLANLAGAASVRKRGTNGVGKQELIEVANQCGI